MKPSILTICLLCSLFGGLQGQGYTNWISGDTSDFISNTTSPGLVLAGGGGDHDQAMIWMLERAGGGDVLVLRASGSDGYNSYFFSELGVEVNSVETIRFDGIAAASDPYVLRRIEEAEVLFFAGGDQYDYYTYWKDNAVEDAIQSLIDDKQITLGGTSAGMAVLGHIYYTPSSSGIISAEALSNPYHPFMDILGKDDFIQAPFMSNTVTDTHFDQRNRAGRLMAFMARGNQDFGVRTKGIACNEFTAVTIDENGWARAFGEYPDYEEDQVYFLQTNCVPPIGPETCAPGEPLDWNRDGMAVKTYRIPAKWTGDHGFSLVDWTLGEGGFWEDWFVDNGSIAKEPDALAADCAAWTHTSKIPEQNQEIGLSPNPASDILNVAWKISVGEIQEFRVYHINGTLMRSYRLSGKTGTVQLDLRGLDSGMYYLLATGGHPPLTRLFLKQ